MAMWSECFPRRLWTIVLALISPTLFLPALPAGAADAAKEYVIDYPAAKQFCPPLRSTFFEVTRTLVVVRGVRVRQKPNGGYGLPVADKVDGKNLLHVGADLGWRQVDEPVFAVANGVVRLSIGPEFDAKEKKRGTTEASGRGLKSAALPWGNLIVIEHRLANGEYYTTLYGHLGAKRLVRAGDVVTAGRMIGAIGRQHPRINGGYKPHLHFGVLKGRLHEEGADLIRFSGPPGVLKLTLRKLDPQWSEVEFSRTVPLPFRVTYNDQPFEVVQREGKLVLDSSELWRILRPDFPLVGYALTTDGFEDPVQFLRRQRADTNPAPFRLR